MKGASPTISTIIIFSILLSAVIFSVMLSYDLLEINAEIIEFKNGENEMLYLAYTIETLASNIGASASVRFNTRTAVPSLIFNYSLFRVTVNSITVVEEHNIPVIIYTGGSKVFGVSKEDLRGVDALIVNQTGIPLLYTYKTFNKRAMIIIDPVRIRVTYLGVFNFSTPDGWKLLNVVSIEYIQFERGVLGGSGTITIYIKNINVTKETYLLAENTITINAIRQDILGKSRMENYVINGESVDGTVIVFSKSKIKISFSLG